MTKNFLYLGLALVVGIGLGYLFFSQSSATDSEVSHEHNQDHLLGAEQQWTCAMHPQIVRTEPGDCPICGMSLIPLQLESDRISPQQFQLTAHAAALANIETTTVGETWSGAAQLQLSGTIAVNEDEVFVQPAHFNGRIEKLYVTSVGQHITKGQLVAKIYSPALISAQQELITAYKLRASQPDLYLAVRKKFKNWMIHDTQLQEIEHSGRVINPFNIYAHVSGTVSEITVKEGDHIMDGNAIFKVANLKTVWAEFDAYENQLRDVSVGQDVTIATKAYPNQTHTSKIAFIDPILNANTRTVAVRVVLNNTDQKFKPGMFVSGIISRAQQEPSELLSIPASAVLWTGKRSVVYLKMRNDTPVFEMREIELGAKVGENYDVLNGLHRGDVVVTHGTFTVDAAAQLQGKPSMMNKQMDLKSDSITVIDTKIHTVQSFDAVPIAFQKELETFLYSYINLKDKLVASDLELATKQAKQLWEQLQAIEATALSAHPKMQETWLTLSHQMKNDMVDIQNVKALSELRSQFSVLSLDLKQLIETFGISVQVYVQYCPMANKNRGGYWLSLSEDILNPYYGDQMLSCGENDKILG
ncbi:efflux RND transporter periplasmic adaptor subunit [Formosa sediminum]|uniref:Efflux RND transporter periplasmic adaptor subunit n=1 Tax=Formosa sediminum TaxID=2594004 RepID=A0A516GRS0_9FLAO|nr:efflux RND transporter periplasmic adaptor subunit [Formosa sediminum]QDO94203.1 efflux RND transporter periplasmic adaptor subunit [Formosa sediminum]